MDSVEPLDDEAARRLLTLPGRVGQLMFASTDERDGLESITGHRQEAIQQKISERNAVFFEAEAEKLDGWSDDLKVGLEREIKDLDFQIKIVRREAKLVADLESKLAFYRRIKDLESTRSRKRRDLYEAQDDIDAKKEELIAKVEANLKQEVREEPLFSIRWFVQ
jgi:adenine-specific DNA-methyltransferase